MAEVFGVIASSLTIAQVVGEILSGVREIHDLCSSVRNFPEKINEAVIELNLLCQVLQNLQKNPSFFGAVVDSAILRYCHEIAKDLQFILSKIQNECSTCKGKKRYWAPFKTYVRKESMDEMYRRLERAKTMLNLVVSSHILMTQQKTTTVTPSIDSKATPRSPTVSASNDVKAEAVREPPCQNTKMFFPTTNHWISSFFGVYSHHSGVTRTIQVKHGRMQVSEGELVIKRVILPSAWLRLWGVSITCMRRNLGWEYLFTPIRVVSDCSPIFRACREGDIHEVISLLNNSQATLQDTSEWGWSLLHIAAMHAQVELCQWLLQNGCKGNIVDVKNGWTPLLAISALSGRTRHSNLIKKKKELGILRAPEVEYPSSRIQDVMRVLVEQGSYDPLDLSKTGWSTLHEYSGPAGPFRYLIEQQQAYLFDLKGLSTEQHTDLAWSLADQYWRSSAELLLIALTNGLTPNVVESFQPAWNRHRSCTLLHIEAQRLDHYGFSGYSLDPSLQIMAKYISQGASLHSRDSFGATPLDDILSYKGHDRDDHKVTVLAHWMELLHSLNIDLAGYFQEEERIHSSRCVVHVKYYRPMIDRKFSVEYGNMGKKVTIKVVDMVRNISEPSVLPGSWIEERGGFERDAFGRYVCRNTTPSAEYSVLFES